MTGLDSTGLVALGFVFLFAGIVKGAIGIGLPTIGMGLMSIWLPIETAAAVLVIPVIATNLWQGLGGGALGMLARRLWPMMAGLIAGTVAVASVVTGGKSDLASIVLGAILMVYAVLDLAGARFEVNPRQEVVLGPTMGVATGLITGATAIFLIPAVPYLQSIRLERDALVQAFGLTALVAAFSLSAGLGASQSLSPWVVVPGGIATAAAFAGMPVGRAVRSRIGVDTFRRVILVALVCLGASMVVRALI